MMDWDDVRVFIAVAQTGSASAAAKRLGVNQTTVARRIWALEQALGVQLFERRQNGYNLTEAGETLVGSADAMAESARQFELNAAGQGRLLSGRIRVTSTEILANTALMQWLTEFMDLYPDISVDLVATERRLDLVAGEADVAIRAAKPPTESGIVFRKLSDSPWAVFCSKAYATKWGVPANIAEAQSHPVVGVEGYLEGSDFCQWLFRQLPEANVRTKCVNLINLSVAIGAGQGIGPLPYSVALHDKNLMECFPLPMFGHGYFLITNAALKDLPRIRAFNHFIAVRAVENQYLLDGRQAFSAIGTDLLQP